MKVGKIKQIQRTNQQLPVGRGKGEENKKDVREQQIQTTLYTMNKPQRYIVQHRATEHEHTYTQGIQPIFYNNFKWSIIYKNIE